MPISKIERETVISFNEADEEAMVWSCSPRTIRQIQKMGFHGENRGTKESKWFQVPKSLIAFRKKNKARRPISEKTKKQLNKRLIAAREARAEVNGNPN